MSYRVLNSQLICADYERSYPWIVRGEGCWLFDDRGGRYLDASGATAAVTHLGHGNPRIAEALAQQARTLAVHPTHLFHSPIVERYFERLLAFAPSGFTRAWTISGGTEAVENAVKLAFQYHRVQGRGSRRRVIGRWSSYHGNSILALDIGGMVGRRSFYTDLMPELHLHLSPCLPYRRPEGQSVQDYEDGLVEELERCVAQHPDQIAAFIAEPIVGSALGAAGPTPTYFERIASICRAHDIVMIADEVMTGFGRTGKNFGCEHFGTHADVLACAKGISGGYIPLGALLVRDEIAQTLRESGDPFFSGQTYSCIPLAAAVGIAVLDEIEGRGLVQNAAETGDYLKQALQDHLGDLPCIGEIRGRGLFLGVEFVADRATKEPFPSALRFSKRVEASALRHGIAVLGARGTVDRVGGDHLLLAPPLILDRAEADHLARGLRAGIVDALADPGGPSDLDSAGASR
ncbi:MAG: aspartate aminotransferase family protein [Deltaproteobacteria bacterium]|nr:MAG: aspartate aminotransferase family protein [Deltaproteobacteria bacterium]